jgi:hypothetical protein
MSAEREAIAAEGWPVQYFMGLRGEGKGEGEGILFSLRGDLILFSFTKH